MYYAYNCVGIDDLFSKYERLIQPQLKLDIWSFCFTEGYCIEESFELICIQEEMDNLTLKVIKGKIFLIQDQKSAF